MTICLNNQESHFSLSLFTIYESKWFIDWLVEIINGRTLIHGSPFSEYLTAFGCLYSVSRGLLSPLSFDISLPELWQIPWVESFIMTRITGWVWVISVIEQRSVACCWFVSSDFAGCCLSSALVCCTDNQSCSSEPEHLVEMMQVYSTKTGNIKSQAHIHSVVKSCLASHIYLFPLM